MALGPGAHDELEQRNEEVAADPPGYAPAVGTTADTLVRAFNVLGTLAILTPYVDALTEPVVEPPRCGRHNGCRRDQPADERQPHGALLADDAMGNI
jgi:hypothetical protein